LFLRFRGHAEQEEETKDILNDVAVIFGGEIDPSEKGHAGAGSFENDVWILDGTSSSVSLVQRITSANNYEEGNEDIHSEWPTHRGWASAASIHGSSSFYLFGGLSGDDENPTRLDDLWICTFYWDTTLLCANFHFLLK